VVDAAPDVPVQRERRDREHQAPDVHGRRASDPCLTAAIVARRLGVTPTFIRNEIKAGHLAALVFSRRSRKGYRVTEAAFQNYMARHWPATPVSPSSARDAPDGSLNAVHVGDDRDEMGTVAPDSRAVRVGELLTGGNH
jgi:hypothetical protein